MEIRTYEELRFFIDFFKKGGCNLLILSSHPGLGKSFAVDEALNNGHKVISSHATPLSIYLTLWENIDKPIVIRDVDGLLYSNDNTSILKMLTESKEVRTISWLTTMKLGNNGEDIPPSFETRSPLLIETNNIDYLLHRVQPLADRGWVVRFEPDVEEVINKIDEIRKYYSKEGNDEVFNLIKKFASYSTNLSLRLFTKGLQLYRYTKGQGWKDLLLREMQISEKLVKVRKLLEVYKSDKERLSKWKNYGWSRASYYNYKKKILPESKSKNLTEI